MTDPLRVAVNADETMPPAEAVNLVIADMRADGWNGTWQGLREYAGFKKAPTKDDLAKFLANLKSALNRVTGDDPDIGADDILRDDKAKAAVAGAISALSGLLVVSPAFDSPKRTLPKRPNRPPARPRPAAPRGRPALPQRQTALARGLPLVL